MASSDETFFNLKRLHLIFAVCSATLLGVTVWMLAADHFCAWKVYQRTFRDSVEPWLTEAQMRELETCVTGGTQTHASDGMATLLVASQEKAREISSRPEIDIQFVAKDEVRTLPALMPEAPALAVQKILNRTGFKMDDMVVVKNHNPFAINDVIFAKALEYDWHQMNKTGCPLVWGHPQGPTLTRVLIEALEEAVELGGGNVLIFGCAAGDVGIAAILKVTERR